MILFADLKGQLCILLHAVAPKLITLSQHSLFVLVVMPYRLEGTFDRFILALGCTPISPPVACCLILLLSGIIKSMPSILMLYCYIAILIIFITKSHISICYMLSFHCLSALFNLSHILYQCICISTHVTYI